MKSSVNLETIATKLHENKSQGVLWRFKRGPQIWTERQKRFLVVGGELDGQHLTRYEISQSKWVTFYQEYHRVRANQPEAVIWVYMPV